MARLDDRQTVALERLAEGVHALVSELRRGEAKGAKRARSVARKVLAKVEHQPTELERAAARRVLRQRRMG